MFIQHWNAYASGAATGTAADTVLRPVLSSRGYFCIANTMPVTDMTQTLWVNFGEAATGNAGIPVNPGDRFELTQDNMTGVSIHTAGADVTFSWVEGVRA